MEYLSFHPIYQTRVWGGRRLESLLGRRLPDAQPYGESWELCDRPEAQSVVARGAFTGKTLHDLWTNHRDEVFGRRHREHPSERFPLLLKILDCCDALSLQVHPPPAIARSLGGEPKTEMWFVAQANEEAKIHAGLRRGVTRAQFEAALKSGAVADLVSSVTPRAGQFMFVPSGRIHALGAGLLIYEVQQNSDTTYRVFDWNRKGLDGKSRPLHLVESLASIDFEDLEPAMQSPAPDGMLAKCPYFRTRHAALAPGTVATLQHSGEDFMCLAIVRGSGTLDGRSIRSGDFVLLPAGLDDGRLATDIDRLEWIEITLPQWQPARGGSFVAAS